MIMHNNDPDRPEPRRTFPASPPVEPPRKNWNDLYEVEVYRGKDGDYRFRIKSRRNAQVVAVGEGYQNRADMEKTLAGLFPQATVPGKEQ